MSHRDPTGCGISTPSLRANLSRECAPDDRLREAIQLPFTPSFRGSRSESPESIAPIVSMVSGLATSSRPGMTKTGLLRRRRPTQRRFDTPPHSRGMNRTRVLPDVALKESKGAGNAGRTARARSLACETRKHTSVVTAGRRKRPAFPARMVLTFLRTLPGDRAFLPPSPAEHHPPT